MSTPSETILLQFTGHFSVVFERPAASQISSSVPCTHFPDKPLPLAPATLSKLRPPPPFEKLLLSSFLLRTGSTKTICDYNVKTKQGLTHKLVTFLDWSFYTQTLEHLVTHSRDGCILTTGNVGFDEGWCLGIASSRQDR